MVPSEKRLHARPVALNRQPASVAAGLAHLPGLVFLDTSTAESLCDWWSGRRECSIVAACPTRYFRGNLHDPEARAQLGAAIRHHRVSGMDLGFPLGGLVGWVEYEGDFLFGEYPEMLIYDYSSKRWVEVGQLSKNLLPSGRSASVSNGSFRPVFEDSTSQEAFCDSVRRAKDYIASGDIYQVNLSHRFRTEWNGTAAQAFALYEKLRYVSPAPFSAFLSLEGKTVLSASPEQFLRISGRSVETRPIKGTRPRFADRERDEKSAYDLITSPKEISELIMITDLERNDLGQVCEFGSVEATELLKLERFAQVFHLVSTVQGRLRSEVSHIDALEACFPGGSVTGAPKKRAREIIAELETVARGLYTGTLGCLGFNEESLFSILIRTAVCEGNTFDFHVGAGIVADSNPNLEWEETLHKAAGILRLGED